jgi:FKBP-type peptidyl-prolyl cis-trans isomerase FkpA
MRYVKLALAAALFLTACDDDVTGADDVSALQVTDITMGTGETARSGSYVSVHYTGWLYDEDAVDHKGRQFGSSRDGGDPLTFTLGTGEVIRGWEQGIPGMRVGGIRRLIIPSSHAYGPGGYGEIPGGSALVFDVELVGVVQ